MPNFIVYGLITHLHGKFSRYHWELLFSNRTEKGYLNNFITRDRLILFSLLYISILNVI